MRLIDADALVNILTEELRKEMELLTCTGYIRSLDIIEKQSAAFDVEAVCEQLKNNVIVIGYKEDDELKECRIVELDTALDIVRKGGTE